MNIILKSKREIAEDTQLFAFASTDQPFHYVPGQYACLKLNLKHSDAQGPERFFSIVNADGNGKTLEFATRISGTGFKQTLAGMAAGEAAEITRIGGDFTLPGDPSREIVMVAGGVGITPFHCMLQSLALKGEKRAVTLLYSNKNRAGAAFYDELLRMEADRVLQKAFFVMTRDESWPGPKGRINADFIRENIPETGQKQFMVAGPPNFVAGISQALSELKAGDVRLEKFFGY